MQWVLNPRPHPPHILKGEGSAIWARAYWQRLLEQVTNDMVEITKES